MSDSASVSMMLCAGLEPVEQEKVERLDGAIWETFHRTGYAVRICQGRTDGDNRFLDFCGPKGIAASIPADEFLAASDDEAVNIIARSCP
jgi:hypothetical protein